MLQSWAYGEAKSDESGWQVKRGVFYRANEPFAMVKVLQKRVAGIMLVARINRGPLFLSPPGAQEARAVWAQLGSLGSLWRGRVLTVAPGLALTGLHLSMMDDLGYRQFSPRAWESVWVDLRTSLTTLRQKLDGKWRNVLAFSEKTDLKLEAGGDDQLFDWMLTRYRELMRDKDFSGMPVDLLLALRQHLPAESRLIVMRAMRDTQAVAGICLVCHGSAATYLLGWNGPEGRKLKANQCLLWQAVVYLKQAGLDWFDLGGIDEDHTPGIAAFKLGLRGERYELAGEYWKW
ncbi:MAG: GNAT family N-acetyltransferase [Cytophaga sp.]|nr:GNAT family N-acetyltransferase [Undibacterium sp.]